MKGLLGRAALITAIATPAAAQQTFTGRLSDSVCAGSHQARASAGPHSDRECLFVCIRAALAKYVLVDPNQGVIPIANQDAMGFPLYAGRPVRITGELKGDALFVTRIEAIPAHLHIGHVMTNWRDTPGTRGFLPVAVDESRVAALHAGLAAKTASLDDFKLHAAHVLHALDPAVESKGPGAGYGVRKAIVGALEHLELARKAEGATPSITTHAGHVSSSLANVLRWVDQAVAAAQGVRASTTLAEATATAAELVSLIERINDQGLQPAQAHMELMLKAEGLLGAPR